MNNIRTVLGFDMETDIGSWTPWYNGFKPGTEMILSVLKKNNITATFFFTADAAQKNREVIEMVRDAGHEIGAHTLYHETIGDSLFEIPGMMPILPSEVEGRLALNTEIIEKIKASGSEVILMTPQPICARVHTQLRGEVLRGLAKSLAQNFAEGGFDRYMQAARAAAEETGVPLCDVYAKWKRMSELGVNVTELLANKLNHPTRDMHDLFAFSLIETMMS